MSTQMTISPFLTEEVLKQCGLKPEASERLQEAHRRGSISPTEISALFPASATKNRAEFSGAFAQLIKILRAANIKVSVSVTHTHVHQHVHTHIHETSTTVTDSLDLGSKDSVIPTLPKLVTQPTGKESGKLPTKKRQLIFHPSVEKLVQKETEKSVPIHEDAEIEPDEKSLADIQTDENGDTEEFIPEFVFDKEDKKKLNPYYRAVFNYPLIPHKEMLEFARQVREEENLEAFQIMICHNLRLVLKVASCYMGRGLDYDDLVQEGNIGLMKAAERFNYRLGYHFSTYATWWIRQGIARAIANFANTIRTPVHVIDAKHKIWRATEELATELEREPTIEEISMRTGIDAVVIKKTMRAAGLQTVSLEETVWQSAKSGNESTLGELLMNEGVIPPDMFLEIKEARIEAQMGLQTLMATLRGLSISDRHREIFMAYYDLDGVSEGLTLEDLGKKYDVTRERIRQILVKVMTLLRATGLNVDGDEIGMLLRRADELDKIVGERTELENLPTLTLPARISETAPASPTSNPEIPVVAQDPGALPVDEIEKILAVVAESYGTTAAGLKAKGRKMRLAWARHVAVYLLREDVRLSFPDLGDIMGGRDHTTIMNSHEVVALRVKQGGVILSELATIRAKYAAAKAAPLTSKSFETGESADPVWDAIAQMVLEKIGAAFNVTPNLLKKRSTDPNITQPRLLAVHILSEDFAANGREIMGVFGLKDRTSAYSMAARGKQWLESQPEVQAKLSVIREEYSLGLYGSDILKLLTRQKTLFPKQLGEAVNIAENIAGKIRCFKEVVSRMTELNQRHVGILLEKNGLHDDSFEVQTLEMIGQRHDLTRERIRQMVTPIWEKLSQHPDLELNSQELLEKALDEWRSWAKIICASV